MFFDPINITQNFLVLKINVSLVLIYVFKDISVFKDGPSYYLVMM